MERLRGKVAIVTGAASPGGLGNACVTAFLREGAAVLMTDINVERIESTAAAHAQTERLGWMGHDVGDEGEWEKVLAEALARFGRLDILVNNAGIGVQKAIGDMSLHEWDDVIRINLTGTFLGARAAMRQMNLQGGGGSIVNISSLAGIVAMPGTSAYTASKGGVRMMSKAIALEGAASGIRCNSVHPGIMWTEIQRVTIENGTLEGLKSCIPVGELGTPEDIAHAVLYLASDESKYVTGTELIVDGGFSAQ